MVNLLNGFLLHLADLTRPIRKITYRGTQWEWEADQQNAFERIKKVVSATPILAYYRADLSLVVKGGKNQSGPGAVILQNWGGAIDCHKRNLFPTKKNYAHIEKEMRATVFALESVHTYTYGRRTAVQTDLKPLITVARTPLSDVPKLL